jgi:hypothetical protein
MDIRDVLTSKHTLNRGPRILTLTHQGLSHEMPLIVRAYRHETKMAVSGFPSLGREIVLRLAVTELRL